MERKHGKIDLLDLPDSERVRICREIHAALEERACAVKISLADDVIVADKTVLVSSEVGFSDSQRGSDVRENASFLSALMKRIW